MTLLHMDGYEVGDQLIDGYVQVPNGGTTTSTRFGYGQALFISSASSFMRKDVTPSASVVVGFAFNASVGGGPVVTFLSDAGATTHVVVSVAPDGTITAKRGTTVVATYAAGALTGWHYLEVKATISDTVGIIQVRLDGSATNLINFTGDTKNAGTSTNIDRILWNGLTTTSTPIDDCYVLNSLGTLNNDFLGDVRIFTLSPTGNGTYSQFVGSDGNSVDNYLLVDELPYGTADYVGSPTTGNSDSYVMADLPATVGVVFATKEVAVVEKSDAGAASIKQLVRSGGTDYTASAVALGTTFTSIGNIRETNPATSAAWSVADVNAVEVGVQVG